jgi:hypothetical protein
MLGVWRVVLVVLGQTRRWWRWSFGGELLRWWTLSSSPLILSLNKALLRRLSFWMDMVLLISLLAGRGGEGGRDLDILASDSKHGGALPAELMLGRSIACSSADYALLVPWWKLARCGGPAKPQINRRWCLRSAGMLVTLLLMAGLGGEGEGERSRFPAGGWCLVISRAEHAAGSLAAAILGRQGGPSSTSCVEALQRILSRSSSPSRSQVVCPRRRAGDRRQRCFFAGRGYSSYLPQVLGGDALRTPALCGRGTKGPDCTSFLYSGVFIVIWEALSSNYLVLCTSVVKELFCKMYLPCE